MLPVTIADEIGYCGHWEALVRNEPFYCGAGRAGCAVLPDGEVVPCTTLDISTSAGNVCATGPGVNRLYAVSIFDGRGQTNLDAPGEDFDPADRAIELAQGGIAPGPQLLFPDAPDGQADKPVVAVGIELPDIDVADNPLRRTFWVER